jgi:hypothetical protein
MESLLLYIGGRIHFLSERFRKDTTLTIPATVSLHGVTMSFASTEGASIPSIWKPFLGASTGQEVVMLRSQSAVVDIGSVRKIPMSTAVLVFAVCATICELGVKSDGNSVRL